MASGRRLALEKYDPVDTLPFDTKENARRLLNKRVRRLYDLTQLLFAQNRWSVLFIFQAMDGAGKDSAIKHVMRGLDPKATQVFSFKLPSTEKRKHHFMWRCMKSLPERGRIGIFNRSYYEEVLVSRVHPELLVHQQLPKRCVSKRIWHDRFEDIRAIERYLARNGTVIQKIFLNVSKTEQRRRFLERLNDPAKKWKFSVNDVNERLRWKEYMAAYEKALCSRAPRTPRGTSSQPTTSGLHDWPSLRLRSKRLKASTCKCRSFPMAITAPFVTRSVDCGRVDRTGDDLKCPLDCHLSSNAQTRVRRLPACCVRQIVDRLSPTGVREMSGRRSLAQSCL